MGVLRGFVGFLDAVGEGGFKRSADGRMLFFPWSPAGRGYEVPTQEEYLRLRRTVRWGVASALVFGPLAATLVSGYAGPLPAMALLAAFALYWSLRLAWVTRRLARTDERTTVAESRARTARALTVSAIWCSTAVMVGFAAAGLGIYLAGEGGVFLVASVLLLLLAVAWGRGWLRLKRRVEQGTR